MARSQTRKLKARDEHCASVCRRVVRRSNARIPRAISSSSLGVASGTTCPAETMGSRAPILSPPTSNSCTVTPSKAASLIAVAMGRSDLAFSQWLTSCFVTPSASAISCCPRRFRDRASRIRIPMCFIWLRFGTLATLPSTFMFTDPQAATRPWNIGAGGTAKPQWERYEELTD